MRLSTWLLVLAIGACCAHAYEWNVVSWQNVPQAQADDVIDVYFMISPLMEQVYGDIFGYVNLTHAAVGVTNRNTNTSFTINYEAVNTVFKVFVPEIVPSNNSSNKDFIWQNQGAVFIYQDIYVDYWNKGYDLICSINGTTFNKFITSYVANVNQTQPWYNMLDVWVGGWGGHLALDSYNCFDFAFQAFEVLHNYGVTFVKNVVKKNYINLYLKSEPKKVDMTDLATRDKVMAFYSLFHKKVDDIAVLIMDVVFGDSIYLHVDEDTYYEVSATDPFLGWKYIDASLISGEKSGKLNHESERHIFDLINFWYKYFSPKQLLM